MGWIIFWAFLSLFAVLGLVETLVFLLETLALRKVSSIQEATFRIVLKGEEPNGEYLLNTLVLMTDRLMVGAVEPTLEIIDGGLDEPSRILVRDYCEKNPWVRFTEGTKDGII